MPYFEFIALAKDVLISAAAVTGAVVAVKGLSAWKSQLKGRFDYDLARRLLLRLFRYRDAIYDVRKSLIWPHEQPAPPKNKADKMDSWQIQFYGTSKAYQARWEKAQNERTPLCADLVESEVLWGTDLKCLFEKIFELERELYTSIGVHLDFIDPDTDERARVAANKIRLENRDALYAGGKDEYRQEFEKAVEDIEKYLKPKLIQ